MKLSQIAVYLLLTLVIVIHGHYRRYSVVLLFLLLILFPVSFLWRLDGCSSVVDLLINSGLYSLFFTGGVVTH